MEDTSHKLKILSIAGKVTMSEMCRQIVSFVFEHVDQKEINKAREELERMSPC